MHMNLFDNVVPHPDASELPVAPPADKRFGNYSDAAPDSFGLFNSAVNTPKKRGPKGRQHKLTEEQIIQIEALGALLNLEQIADYFGMHKATFMRLAEDDPEIMLRYKSGKSKAIGSVASSLLYQAQNGNIAAAIFYLKTQAHWRETDNKNRNEIPQNVNAVRLAPLIIDETAIIRTVNSGK